MSDKCISTGDAIAIVKNIEKAPFTDNQKAIAIYKVMEMPTHMSITKDDMFNVIKWLWNKHYTFDESEVETE